jgi:thiamine-monophosphate kinase
MNELELVARIRKMADSASGPSARERGVVLGIGHDCAIFRPPPGQDLLLKTDQLIEGVHFSSEMPAEAVGARALARALSDIAAMGGEPRCCLVALTMPQAKSGKWAVDFFKGLLRLARRTQTALAGGDLARDDKVYCVVMLCGSVPRGKGLRRDGARAGDALYVSGRLGKAWTTPIRPRLELGRQLLGLATACMDLSDGLALDLHRLCIESGVAAEVDRVPMVQGASMEHGLERALDRALHGGEDYELLFTLPEGRQAPRGVTRIGRIVKGEAGAVLYQGRKLPPTGWNHFTAQTQK